MKQPDRANPGHGEPDRPSTAGGNGTGDPGGGGPADRPTGRNLVSGTLWSGISLAVSMATGVPLAIILVRTMSARAYGALNFAQNIAGIAGTVAGCGFALATTRYASIAIGRGRENEARSVARMALKLTCVSGLPALAATGVLAALFWSEPQRHLTGVTLYVLLPLVVVTPAVGVLQALLVAQQNARLREGANVITSMLTVGASGTLVALGLRTAPGIGAARVAATVAGAVPLAGVLAVVLNARKRAVRPHQAPRRESPLQGGGRDEHAPVTARTLVAFGLPSLLGSLMWAAVVQLDAIVLGLSRGEVAVGRYQPLVRMAGLAMTLVGLASAYLLPPLSAAAADGDRDRMRRLYHTAIRYGLAIGAPAIGVVLAVPVPAVRLFFGSAVASHSAGVTRLLAIGVLVQVLPGFNGLALQAKGMVRLMLVFSAAGLVTMSGAVVLLVPRFGAVGAALSGATTLGLINVLYSAALWRVARVAPWDGRVALTVASMGAAVALSWIVAPRMPDDALRVAFAAAAVMGATGVAAVATAAPGELAGVRVPAVVARFLPRRTCEADRPDKEHQGTERQAK